MAGYLIVEGDVDEALNTALTGEADPDPAAKSGKYDYRERLMFVQRLGGVQSADPDAVAKRLQNPPADLINGTPAPPTMRMRPGAVERWRFLNGSVDGKGYTRFMVLKGQWVNEAPPDNIDITNLAPQ
jgi:hypothetical protein